MAALRSLKDERKRGAGAYTITGKGIEVGQETVVRVDIRRDLVETVTLHSSLETRKT